MSKRNLILLIIVLSIIVISVFGFWYLQKNGITPEDPGTGTNFFSQFNPFGNSTPKPPVVTPPIDVSGYVPPPDTTTGAVKLTKVSNMPVAGFIIFTKERIKELSETLILEELETGKTTKPTTEFVAALRYVEKATGAVYQTFVDKIQEQKFSKAVMPQVYDAYFGNKGEVVIMRHLRIDGQTIETFVGTLPKEFLGTKIDGNAEIKGSFLPDNVKSVNISPDGQKVFYIFETIDTATGTILNLLTNKKTQVFDSPFTEWLSHWGASNMITLTTKPSWNVPGYMYAIDGAGKNLGKIMGDINGLTTLASPSGKIVLFSDNNLSTNIYQMDTRNSEPLGVKTLPEKCVWGRVSDVVYCAVPRSISESAYPDTWYQGEVSFSDQIWKIDVKTGNATIISDLAVGEEGVDAVQLSLDEEENYLFFVNKKDSFLWKLDLK